MRDDENDWTLGPEVRPRLANKARLLQGLVSGEPLLLYPEGVLWLNATAAAVVGLCDGRRALAAVVAELADRYGAPPDRLRGDVSEFLSSLSRRGLLGVDAGEGGIP